MANIKEKDLYLVNKIRRLPKFFLFITGLLFSCGLLALYSASNGSFHPWAFKHIINALIALPIMFIIILTDIRVWYRYSYYLYGFGILLLLSVMFFGVEGALGAQRWIAIGSFTFQPSELMKVFLVLALARYYHNIHFNNLKKFRILVVPSILIAIAVLLILKQPNLGTAAIIAMVGGLVILINGLTWKKILFFLIIVASAVPILWANMHDYQKKRVETFLDPERDPLGAGYNIIQSKIAIGSGGMYGKGFTKGTQSQLNFVPEQQTDFIFSIVAEEFGFAGSIILLILFMIFFFTATLISNNCRSSYSSIVAVGMAGIIFIHVFVNVGMVSGMLPVVGVPLPFVSYGGSSLISSLIAASYIASAYIHAEDDLRNI